MDTRMMHLSKHLRFYREQRLSTIPIPYGKKEANIKWQVYQERLPTDAEIAEFFNKPTNIAVVCGKVSGNLIVLDCDSQEKFYELGAVIKEKTGVDDILDFTLVVKTDRGFHIYLRTEDTIKTQKFPKLEIRGEGSYVLVPPSLHPNGTLYEFLNPDTPIALVNTLMDIGIEQKPLELPRNQTNWVTQALQGVSEGERNDTCMRLAGYFKNKHPQDITENLLLNWNSKNKPPLPDKEILTTISSVYRYDGSYPNADNNTSSLYTPQMQDLASKQDNFGTTSGQDKGKEWGFYAQKFDEFMQEANGRVDKREVAEAIGLKVASDTFRKILSRRKSGDKPQVRAYRGSHNLIEWINRDYRITPEDIGIQAMLEIRLPLNTPEYVKIPSRSVAGIAGYKSTGKTAFLLETAELNVYSQELLVYYWYNEMGELLLNRRLEDYPLLLKARRDGRFKPVMQTTFEFTDVIEPDAINLIDYIDRDDDIWLIGEDIRKIFTPLNKGCSIFALQKKRDSKLGYGGTPTLKLSTLYITLDEKYHSEKATHGIAKIIVCKNWENINPVGLSCEYHTGGKHGKLFLDGEWQRH